MNIKESVEGPIQKGTLRKTLLLFFSVIVNKSITIKSINFVLFSLQGLPPLQKLDFGLFSAVLLPLEPAILFSNWSAVSPSKSRDFRLYEPTILFSNWPAVSPSKTHHFRLYEPTIPFSTWSAVSHPTSGHDVTRPIRSHHLPHTVVHYYSFALRCTRIKYMRKQPDAMIHQTEHLG